MEICVIYCDKTVLGSDLSHDKLNRQHFEPVHSQSTVQLTLSKMGHTEKMFSQFNL